MNLFFDTSALVKYFHAESGSEDVIKLLDNYDNDIWVSEITAVEFSSTLNRRFRMGEISARALNLAIKAFEIKLTKEWILADIDSQVFATAKELIHIYGKAQSLRTLDAIQLASFKCLQEDELEFVLSDVALSKIAKDSGVRVKLIN